jgi:TolB-like protein/DNA-binding winged helix-turn-helix (wHTH) protein/Flp pilus assembly protein TadD
MDTSGAARLLRFGQFEADLRTGELRKAGRKIRIQEQPFKVLVALLARPGEMLSREELRDQVWGAGTFVDFDTGLNKAILRIREVLGDSAESPVFIETLPRRGYRFIAPVESVWMNAASSPPATAGSAPAPRDTAPMTPALAAAVPAAAPVPAPDLAPPALPGSSGQERWLLLVVTAVVVLGGLAVWAWWARSHPLSTFSSIAVLPLENLSNSADEEYFADGITDELITELAKISSLRVISRTSVMSFKRARRSLGEIARELGASAIVEGTVLRTGDRVRVTAQLIDAVRDRHIWAQSYEQSLGDILTLQRRVAQDIAAHVNAKLTDSEQQRLAAKRSIQPAAYEDYLKGRFFWNKRTAKDAQEAIHYFEQAIAAQPDYAEAYAGVAEAYAVLGWDGAAMPPDEAFPKAKAAALRALEIDPSAGAAHVALMWVELFYQWNWTEAEKEAREAIRLSPNSSTAHHHYSRLLAFTGRSDEALAESRKSVELDPLDPIAGGGLAWNSYLARHYDEAIQQSRQMIDMYPSMQGFYEFLGWSYEAQGRFPEALEALEQARARDPSAWAVANLGYCYGASGNRPAALSAIEKLAALARPTYVPPYYFALVYAGLHENDQAFDWLERAYKEHAPDLVFLKTDPKLDPLRSDLRFAELMRRVGFAGAR